MSQRKYSTNNLTFLSYQYHVPPSCRPALLCVQRRRRSDGGCASSVSSSAAPCQNPLRALLSLPPYCSPRMDTPRGWCSHRSRLRNKPAPHLAGQERTISSCFVFSSPPPSKLLSSLSSTTNLIFGLPVWQFQPRPSLHLSSTCPNHLHDNKKNRACGLTVAWAVSMAA